MTRIEMLRRYPMFCGGMIGRKEPVTSATRDVEVNLKFVSSR